MILCGEFSLRRLLDSDEKEETLPIILDIVYKTV
jgi:hypothetical protein